MSGRTSPRSWTGPAVHRGPEERRPRQVRVTVRGGELPVHQVPQHGDPPRRPLVPALARRHDLSRQQCHHVVLALQ